MERILGRIEITDTNIDNIRTFYSCLYRSVLFQEPVGDQRKGEVIHYSPFNGKVVAGEMFTDTRFWDTFRALFPFLNLVYPYECQNAGRSGKYLSQSGFLPSGSARDLGIVW